MSLTMAVFLFCLTLQPLFSQNLKPFVLRFIDPQNKRAIPLVELESENGQRWVSDNDGHISIFAPDLNGKNVRLRLRGHGYVTRTVDFWGQQSVNALIQPGEYQEVSLWRTQPARRLYRITGSGRYNHTILAGRSPSFNHNLLPGQVIGQDSLICVPWKGRLWHFYGDTLGVNSFNFSASCATVPMPDQGGFDPRTGIPLEYLVDENGFAARMIETGKPGFTWIEYVLPVLIENREWLLAKYVQHKTLDEVGDAGFALMNEKSGRFKIVKRLPDRTHHKCTHPVPVRYKQKKNFLLFPWELTATDFTAITNSKEHLYFSCLKTAKTIKSGKDTISIDNRTFFVEKDKGGQIIYRWQKNVPPVSTAIQRQLLEKGLLKPNESLFAPIEIESGKRVFSFNGAIAWNSFKNRWIMINQGNRPGEIIYSEADTPTGPWAFASKVCSFDDYNFYNPLLHPWYDRDGGREIFFEGTFTNYFSPSTSKVPEADYNQVMFNLDLDDSRLILPVPIYRVTSDSEKKYELLDGPRIRQANSWSKIEKIEFFAFPETADHPDLVSITDHDNAVLPFKLLRIDPQTDWGKKWVTLAENNYQLNSETFAKKGQVFIIQTAECFSFEIENTSW